MLYAAPPLRTRPPFDSLDILWAARGGLGGGDGIPELTSGTPLGPASPRSGVVEALERRGGSVYDVGASADIGGRAVATITTTTTTASFVGDRHCSVLPRLDREHC